MTGYLEIRVVTARIDPEALTFRAGQMREIGEDLIVGQNDRLDQGHNRFDQAMPPLKESYRKGKVKRGGQPVRDLRLSGQLRSSVQVVEAEDDRVRVTVRGATAQRKAAINQARAAWYGVSPTMAQRTDGLIDAMFAANVGAL